METLWSNVFLNVLSAVLGTTLGMFLGIKLIPAPRPVVNDLTRHPSNLTPGFIMGVTGYLTDSILSKHLPNDTGSAIICILAIITAVIVIRYILTLTKIRWQL